MRTYAIGDIHGQLDMLRAAHDRILADRDITGDDAAPVVHLGDYCDRGPDSSGVLQFLIDGMQAGQPWRALLGNHDRIFRRFVEGGALMDARLRADLTWFSPGMGGRQTMGSYGVEVTNSFVPSAVHTEANQQVPQAHIKFMASLETYIETDDLVFVHAGILPGVPMAEQDEDDLVWIRDGFLEDTRDHGKLVVHGHTALDHPMHCGNRVNLDSGAGYFRPLTVAVFEGRDCWHLTDNGRMPLLP